MRSVMKTTCILLISLTLVFKPIYILLSLFENSNIPVAVYILDIVGIIYGVVLLILNRIKPLNLKYFITYFLVDTFFLITSLTICYRLNFKGFNAVEQGVVGNSFDLIINIAIIIFAIKEIRHNSNNLSN